MGSTTPLLDILTHHLPSPIPSREFTRSNLETFLAFALGGDCPTGHPDARREWPRAQSAAINALHDHLGTRGSTKRARDSQDADDDPSSKRAKTVGHAEADDPPRFTFPSVSATAPVRKKVDVTVHARSIRFVNPTSRVLEASIPLERIAHAFLLPTRGKTKAHWTVVLLPTEVPDKDKEKDKAKASSALQAIFGIDALSLASFDTTSYPSSSPEPTPIIDTVAKGKETAPSIRRLLSHLPVPLLEPSTAVFRSACATPKSGDGAAGIDAYLSAKSGTLWFFDKGILWGESKPCTFWPVEELLPKDGVRLISATGRTCSVILSRKVPVPRTGSDADSEVEEEEVVETVFGMVDGREQDPITVWARDRKHVFGKPLVNGAHAPASGSGTNGKSHDGPIPGGGTIKGVAWDDSDPDDDDFETDSSEDLDHSTDSGDNDTEDASEGSGNESGTAEESEEEGPEIRPGSMAHKFQEAAMDMMVDLLRGGDHADDASEEEDELEE